MILSSAMEPIRFSQKCKPFPTSPPDMLRNTLDVIQRISISNRPRSGGSPIFLTSWRADAIAASCFFLFFFVELHLALCSDTLHTAASSHSCPHCLSFFPLSLLSVSFHSLSLSLSVFCLLSVSASANNTHAWQSQSRKLL